MGIHSEHSFPKGYSTAGGTYMKRIALEAIMKELPNRDKLERDYGEKYRNYFSADTCLYMLAGFAKVDLRASLDVMQSTHSCNEGKDGLLWPCYSCIHSCKLQADCYQSMEWPRWSTMFWLRRLVQKTFLALAQP